MLPFITFMAFKICILHICYQDQVKELARSDGETAAPGNIEEQWFLNQPRFIHNESERFESRFVTLRILDSPSIFLKGMSGSSLGCWSSHGEGNVHFPNSKILEDVLEQQLAPVRYVDDSNQITQAYPFNPNG